MEELILKTENREQKALNISDSGFFDSGEGGRSRDPPAKTPLEVVPEFNLASVKGLEAEKDRDILPENVCFTQHSGVDVFELRHGANSVMRRRTDGFVNATHVLKLVGIPKAERTRILEHRLQNCQEHDKVQGGFVRYQGTWVPCSVAEEFARRYGVSDVLNPLLSIDLSVYQAFQFPATVCESPSKPRAKSFPKVSSLGQKLAKAMSVKALPIIKNNALDKRSASAATDRKKFAVTRTSSATERSTSHSLFLFSNAAMRKDNSPQGIRRQKIMQELKTATWTPCSPVTLLKLLVGISQLRGPCANPSITSSEEEPSRETGANPSVSDILTPLDDEGNTILHLAASCGQLALVKYLAAFLELHKAEISDSKIENYQGRNPIANFIATASSHKDGVSQCFESVLDLLGPRFLLARDSVKNRTLLHELALAYKGDSHAITNRLLEEYGALLFKKIAVMLNPAECKAFVNLADVNGSIALHYALQHNFLSAIRTLLLWGSNIRFQNQIGSTPLSIAACSGSRKVKTWMTTCAEADSDANDNSAKPQRSERKEQLPSSQLRPASRARDDAKLIKDTQMVISEYMHHLVHGVKDRIAYARRCTKQIKKEKLLLQHYINQLENEIKSKQQPS